MTTKATGTPPHEEAREGVYLARLTIENARCFRTRQTLDLTARDGTIAHWTLLIGENGTGKTTLLQSIAALAPTAGMGPAPAPEREAAWHEWRQRRLRWQEVCSAPEQEADRYTELELRPGIAPLQAEAGRSLVRWVDARGFGNGTVATLGLRGESPVFFAYGPHRRASREAFTAGATSDALTALTSDLPLVNVEDWYLRRDYIATNSHNTPAERAAATRSRDRVASLVCRVLPGVEGLVPVTVDAARGETTLMAETDAGRVRVAELGLGFQSTLAWVVDLAVRLMDAYPDSDDPLAQPAVVLVDEIDLHLHPRWQRELLGELSARFPKVQFIATAHSPLIVQAAPDANVVVLRRTDSGVVIDRAPESVRHWRVDQILTSDLFSLPTARPAHLDAMFLRREEILRKPKPTAAERAELEKLHEALDAAPGGESRALLEAEEIMLDLARERATTVKRSAPKSKRRSKTKVTPRSRRT